MDTQKAPQVRQPSFAKRFLTLALWGSVGAVVVDSVLSSWLYRALLFWPFFFNFFGPSFLDELVQFILSIPGATVAVIFVGNRYAVAGSWLGALVGSIVGLGAFYLVYFAALSPLEIYFYDNHLLSSFIDFVIALRWFLTGCGAAAGYLLRQRFMAKPTASS